VTRRLLVTGATGCVGRALVAAGVSRGWSVTGCARRYPTDWPSDAGFEKADVRDATRFAVLAANTDVVVHLAGRAHDERASTETLFSSFVDGTRVVAVAAHAAGARLVVVSSVAVYGSSGANVDNSTSPNPDTPYGAAKLESERTAIAVDPNTIIVRPTLVYGPYDRGNMSRLIRLTARFGPVVFGDGRNRKSIVYAPHLADRIVALLDSNIASGVWCASDQEAPTQFELVGHVARAMHRGARPRMIPVVIARTAARAADAVSRSNTWMRRMDRLTSSSVVDGRELDAALDFRETTTFERALERTVLWTLGG
jgi:nucleoside-diphosphate-sugar epimerase